MKFRLLPLLMLIAVAAGCHNKPPDEKAEASKRWNDTRATVLLGVAQDQYKAHDFDKCSETLGKALKMEPASPALHVLAAKVAIEQGRLELAEKELETARQYGPKDPEAFYLSGVIYQRWQKPQTALEFYRQAGERAPAELQYLLAQGEMLVALGRTPEALQLLQSKVTYFENSATIRDAVGQLLLQMGRYAEAVDMFRQAGILAEDNTAIRERLAMACFYNKQYRECAELLSQLIQKDGFNKRADLFAVLGECRFNLNDSHGARRAFETATELNPYSAPYWQSLGRATLDGGDLRGAELALRRSIGIDPSLSETHLLLGYVRLKQAKLGDALASFQKASTLNPQDTVSLCMVGYTYEKLGKTEQAMQWYTRAMKIRPGDEMAQQLMAEIK